KQGGAKKYLIPVGLGGRLDHLGDGKALCQETNAPVDLAQALLSVQVVAVFRTITIGGGPRDDLNHIRPLHVHKMGQLCAQTFVAGGSDVVLCACRKGNSLGPEIVFVVAVGLFYECLVHKQSMPKY